LDPLTTEEFQNIINEKIWSQLILPPKMGGFGIQDPLLTHLPAFIAAASVGTFSYLHLKNAMNAGCEWFKHDQYATPEVRFSPALTDIHLALSENCTVELLNTFKEKHNIKDISMEDLTAESRLQTFLASRMYSSINSAYKKTLTRQDLDRINSCCYEGAVLITVLPCHEDFCVIGEHLFRERLLMRLGLPIPGIVPGKCLCKHGSNDIFGYHLLSVCNKGNQRISTHNAVRDSFREMCKAAGLTTRIEDMETLKQNNIDSKSRVDVICDNFFPGVPMAFDNSIADPRQTGLTVKPIPGKASKKREYSKIEKFQNDLARQGTKFEPFVLESFGRWGYRTRLIFKQLISKIKDNSKLHAFSLDESVITHYWRCKISLAMHRQACLGIHCRIHVLQRHHQLRAHLAKLDLSKKVTQHQPFQNDMTILDELDTYESFLPSPGERTERTLTPAHYSTISSNDRQDQQHSVVSSENASNEDMMKSSTTTLDKGDYSQLDNSIPIQSVYLNNSTSLLRPRPDIPLPVNQQDSNNNINDYTTVLHLYTDGSCKMNVRSRLDRSAGWGVAVYMEFCKCSNVTDRITTTTPLLELFGPVVTNSNSRFFLGAAKQSNNTGELTAIGEALLWLISNWEYLLEFTTATKTTTVPPLKSIVIHSDSTYAINATIGTDSGPCNLQLYSRIRLLLKELKCKLQSSSTTCSENQCDDGAILPAVVPTLSIRKVKGHAGIKGNEKADLLAQRGQYEVCKSGRYSIMSQNKNSPFQCALQKFSKCFSSVETSPSIRNSKHSDQHHSLHVTPFVIQSPSIHCKLPSSLRKNLNSDYFSSSTSQTHNSKKSNEIYNNQKTSIVTEFSHNSPSQQHEQQSPTSNRSLSPRASRQSSPGLHPFGLEDY
jgi:ribonuclease HI